MLSPERQRRLLEIGFFALPVILVQMSGMVLGTGGPTEAEAADDEPAPAPATVTPRELIVWSDEELAAGVRARLLHTAPIERSPMFYEPRAVVDPGDDDPPPTFDTLQVKVNGIMKSSSGEVALIDELPRVIGDTVGGGLWEIVEISTANRSVKFLHTETRETVTRVVPRGSE